MRCAPGQSQKGSSIIISPLCLRSEMFFSAAKTQHMHLTSLFFFVFRLSGSFCLNCFQRFKPGTKFQIQLSLLLKMNALGFWFPSFISFLCPEIFPSWQQMALTERTWSQRPELSFCILVAEMNMQAAGDSQLLSGLLITFICRNNECLLCFSCPLSHVSCPSSLSYCCKEHSVLFIAQSSLLQIAFFLVRAKRGALEFATLYQDPTKTSSVIKLVLQKSYAKKMVTAYILCILLFQMSTFFGKIIPSVLFKNPKNIFYLARAAQTCMQPSMILKVTYG